MTLTELRYIVTLAQEQHFGHAAERCHVSQPTLSVGVKKLEDEFGVLIFERSKSAVRVTPVGEAIVAQAQKVLEQAQGIRELAQAGKNQLTAPLKVGAIYTVGPYLFPHLIQNGADVEIRLQGLPVITVQNVALADLDASDFMFGNWATSGGFGAAPAAGEAAADSSLSFCSVAGSVACTGSSGCGVWTGSVVDMLVFSMSVEGVATSERVEPETAWPCARRATRKLLKSESTTSRLPIASARPLATASWPK